MVQKNFWKNIKNKLSGDFMILAVAGVAGCLFIVPDFIIGTSITKYRAMLMIGFCMALPGVAYAITVARERIPNPVQSLPAGLAGRQPTGVWPGQRYFPN